jgi:membrane carboxypeptidase/penicillin-binding protein PbpC
VNGFESFVNGGTHYDSTPILKVTTPNGEVLEEHSDPQGKRVLDPQVSYLMANILSDPGARAVTFGGFSGQQMTIPGQTNIVKTGTTDNNRDGWMMGGTRHLIGGVWVGHSDNKPMYGITSVMTGAIWGPFMRAAHEGKENLPFEQPAGIKQVTPDNNTGKLPGAGSSATHTDIFPSWYQPKAAPSAQKATIDKVSRKLATECTPPLAREEITGTGIEPEIPPTDPAYQRWLAGMRSIGGSGGGVVPTDKDDVHKCSDVKPTTTISTQKTGNNIKVNFSWKSGTHPVQAIEVSVNGKVIFSQAIHPNGSHSITYKPPDDGKYTFKVVATDAALYQGENSSPPVVVSQAGGGGRFSGILGFDAILPRWLSRLPRQLVSVF